MKKKYIEPHDKLSKNISNKHNIDNTIELFEKLKKFKTDVKVLKVYFEKDNPLSDSPNSISHYQKIKKDIANSNIKGLNYIKDELDWINTNDERIMQHFRTKFQDAIMNMVII